MIWAVTVAGDPAPKGSMKCIGQRGKVKHQVVESDDAGKGKVWRPKATAAAAHLTQQMGRSLGAENYAAVAVGAVFVLARPKSVRRLYPTAQSAGDLDKHCRMLLDALTDGGVLQDDSRVSMLQAVKVYEAPGRKPGLTVFVSDDPNPHHRILTALLDAAPELTEMNA